MRREKAKRLLGDALMEVCDTCDLADVNVSFLVERAGVARQSFYNHFDNLGQCICYAALTPLMDLDDPFSTPENLRPALACARMRRGFYRQYGAIATECGYDRMVEERIAAHLREKFIPAGLDPADAAERADEIDRFIHDLVQRSMMCCRESLTVTYDQALAYIHRVTPAFIRAEWHLA